MLFKMFHNVSLGDIKLDWMFTELNISELTSHSGKLSLMYDNIVCRGHPCKIYSYMSPAPHILILLEYKPSQSKVYQLGYIFQDEPIRFLEQVHHCLTHFDRLLAYADPDEVWIEQLRTYTPTQLQLDAVQLASLKYFETLPDDQFLSVMKSLKLVWDFVDKQVFDHQMFELYGVLSALTAVVGAGNIRYTKLVFGGQHD